MPVIGFSEAARLAQVARSTIQRKVKRGELSAIRRPDGAYGIEVAELERVFGTLQTVAPLDDPSRQPLGRSAPPPTEADSQRVAGLERQLERLERELDTAHQREAWLRGQVEALQQRLLPAPRRGLLARLTQALARRRGTPPGGSGT
jgi:hypothetical protein